MTVHRVGVRGSRTGGGFASRARLELLDASGQPAGAVEPFDLPGPDHDADVVLPSPAAGVARVRFVALAGSGSPALGELQVFGEGDLGAVRHAEADVVFRETGIVDVRVARTDGTSLRGYEVQLSRGGASEMRGTGDDGLVRFLVVPEGSGWTVTATHPSGGASVGQPNVTVAPGPAAPPIELRFPAFASVSGTLLSHARQPVAGSATLASTAGYSRTLSTSASFTSFEFADVPIGTYTLKATDSRSQAVVTTAPFAVAAGPNPAPEVVFPAVGTIRVTTTSGGKAYAGATVSWRSSSVVIGWRSLTTDAAGKVTLLNVAGPTVELEAYRPDLPLAPVKRTVSLVDELAVLDEAFDLPSTTTLGGTLRSLDGVPYASNKVDAWDEAGTTRIAQATTNGAGAFSLTVPPGIVWLRATRNCSTVWGEVRVDLAATATADALLPWGTILRPGQNDFWELNLGSASPVGLHAYGAVNGSAPPIGNPTLQAFRPDGRSAFTAWGSANLDPGRHLLAVGSANGGTGGYGVCSNASTSVGLRPWGGAWARGQVLSGGAPLAGHRVRLVRPALPAVETATGDTGVFALPLVLPGDFTIEVVDADGVVLARTTGTAEPDTDATLAPIDVPARAAVSVLVQRAGAGIAGVEVTLTSDHPAALAEDARRVLTTESDGRASAVVPAGTVTARLDPVATACDKGPQGASACADTKPAPADFVLTLPDLPTTVIVRVTALDGATPLPSAMAEIVGGGGSVAADVDGIVVLAGVPAGRRTVHALAAGREAYQTVDLAGGEATVAIALPVPVIRATLTDSHGANVDFGTSSVRLERYYACNGGICWWTTQRTCVTAPASAGGVRVFDQLGRWLSGYVIDVVGRPYVSNASASANLQVDQASSTVYPVALQLPPTGSVSGTVVASNGTDRAPNANLWIATDGGEPVALVADEEGAFSAPYLLSGHVTVHAEDPQDAIPGQVQLDLAADADEQVQIGSCRAPS